MSSIEFNNPYAIVDRSGVFIYRLPSEMLNAVSKSIQERMLQSLRSPEKPKRFIIINNQFPVPIANEDYKKLLNCMNDRIIAGNTYQACNYEQRYDNVYNKYRQ